MGEIISIYEVENYAGIVRRPRNLQYIHFLKDDKEYTIANVHALWNGMGKTDTEERLQQSIVIKNYMDSAKGLKVLCGDFNLLPDTKSISILEEGMRNLIKNTRLLQRELIIIKNLKNMLITFLFPLEVQK